jgi:alkylation response protein AidB-like acyl-CoA dehydrogenase
MDFAFSEEQEMLREQVRSLVTDRYTPERVVELAESSEGWDPTSWKQFAELGWTGLSVPEEHGGAGFGFLEEAVVLEELARSLYPGPYFSTVMALPALAEAPELLGRVASGEAAATLAWAEPDGPRFLQDLEGAGTKASSSGESWTLSGEKYLVPDLGAASIVVVAARAPEGLGLWAVERSGHGVKTSVKTTVDSTRRLGTLSLTEADAQLLVAPGSATDVIERIRRRAFAAAALEAGAVGSRVLQLSTDYTKERQQFGKPIASFQAVAHQVSNIYMETELSRSLAYWAAWCVDTDDPQAPNAASAAKGFAAEAAVEACESAIQVHGGIGFTWEHILHRYYRRAQWLDAFEGGATFRRKEIARTLLG